MYISVFVVSLCDSVIVLLCFSVGRVFCIFFFSRVFSFFFVLYVFFYMNMLVVLWCRLCFVRRFDLLRFWFLILRALMLCAHWYICWW